MNQRVVEIVKKNGNLECVVVVDDAQLESIKSDAENETSEFRIIHTDDAAAYKVGMELKASNERKKSVVARNLKKYLKDGFSNSETRDVLSLLIKHVLQEEE